MRVIAVDPETIDAPTFVHETWKMDKFDELLSQSDIVVYLCTIDTRN